MFQLESILLLLLLLLLPLLLLLYAGLHQPQVVQAPTDPHGQGAGHVPGFGTRPPRHLQQ
jgi:hypothetical protein